MTVTLTDREREVVALLAEGVSPKAIALRCSISEHTVRFHIRLIAAKIPGPGKPAHRILRWWIESAA